MTIYPKYLFDYVLGSERIIKLPYGYVLVGKKVVMHGEKVDVIRSIFEYYLAGAGLEKSVDMLFARIFPPREKTLNGAGQPRVNLLSNARYITVVGMKTYMDV